ncbi:hypothetical protein VHEMI03181 [[Torrubiella] hemipterigena]|uniref:CFEM domain-containing protein n=1 Tax=[Torrubiella] hemipterigena TaxID=1531966 RepID=A0A0A1TCT1_9HYPO|nr:hypothetical protein VHEMI03181 [[Torrubiella] hemipterigena]
MQFTIAFALLLASVEAYRFTGINGLADCSHHCLKEFARKKPGCATGANDDKCFCDHVEVIKAEARSCLDASCGADFVREKLLAQLPNACKNV